MKTNYGIFALLAWSIIQSASAGAAECSLGDQCRYMYRLDDLCHGGDQGPYRLRGLSKNGVSYLELCAQLDERRGTTCLEFELTESRREPTHVGTYFMKFYGSTSDRSKTLTISAISTNPGYSEIFDWLSRPNLSVESANHGVLIELVDADWDYHCNRSWDI